MWREITVWINSQLDVSLYFHLLYLVLGREFVSEHFARYNIQLYNPNPNPKTNPKHLLTLTPTLNLTLF